MAGAQSTKLTFAVDEDVEVVSRLVGAELIEGDNFGGGHSELTRREGTGDGGDRSQVQG